MANAHREIRAQLMEVRENSGEMWWGTFFKSDANNINKRFQQAKMLYWGPSVKMPLDLFSYVREASLSFTIARYLASIVLSSSAVELILNRDSRTRAVDFRRVGGWATLNNQNLRLASERGLPIGLLLSDGETLDDANPIEFVNRRNKVAHGDILPLIKTLTDYDPFAEREALDQLEKSQRFVVDWFNSAPDVQECHVQGHRWPNPS